MLEVGPQGKLTDKLGKLRKKAISIVTEVGIHEGIEFQKEEG